MRADHVGVTYRTCRASRAFFPIAWCVAYALKAAEEHRPAPCGTIDCARTYFWTEKESDRFLTRSAVFVMSIQHFGKGALRVAKNYTKGYSDVQAKVRDATSNDPWGPSGTQMNEIAQMTYNQFVLTPVPLCFGSR